MYRMADALEQNYNFGYSLVPAGRAQALCLKRVIEHLFQWLAAVKPLHDDVWAALIDTTPAVRRRYARVAQRNQIQNLLEATPPCILIFRYIGVQHLDGCQIIAVSWE